MPSGAYTGGKQPSATDDVPYVKSSQWLSRGVRIVGSRLVMGSENRFPVVARLPSPETECKHRSGLFLVTHGRFFSFLSKDDTLKLAFERLGATNAILNLPIRSTWTT